MLHFIFTYSEQVKGGHTHKTVNVYRIKRNTAHHVITLTDTFVDKGQLVMMALEKAKAMPRRAFERNQFGGHKYMPHTIAETGIATIQEV